MNLIGEEITVRINNKYVKTTYLFKFRNGQIPKTNELRFTLSIDPKSFISFMEAKIDDQIYIGEIKQHKDVILSNNKQVDEEIVSILQLYKDAPNIFEIRANMENKSNISLKLCIEQYMQKQLDYYSLPVQTFHNLEQFNIKKDLQHASFSIRINDINPIYDINLDGNDIKTNDKNCRIDGKIIPNFDEFFLEFKLLTSTDVFKTNPNEQINSYMLFNNKTQTFCHIINSKHIINCMNMTYIILVNGYIHGLENQYKLCMDTPKPIYSLIASFYDPLKVLIPRTVMFVVDTSESMKGIKGINTLESIIYGIKTLRRNIDRFGVIVFNNKVDIIQNITLANDETCSVAVGRLKRLDAFEHVQTNINVALLDAIRLIKMRVQTPHQFSVNQIVMVTDGEPNVGEMNVKNILNNVMNENKLTDSYGISKISIYTFGIDDDLNHSFLNVLAINNNGFYRRLKQNNVNILLNEYLNIISNPILLNAHIKYDTNIYNMTNSQCNAYNNGDEMVICGKFKNKLNNAVTRCTLYGTCGLVNNGTVNEININSDMQIDIINVEEKDMNINNTLAYFKLKELCDENIVNIVLNDNMAEVCDEEIKLLTPWTYMEMKLKRPNYYSKNKPNINRIMNALNQTNNNNKYPNMSVWFKEFLDEQEYNDSDMEHEFGDGCKYDCSFNDWLKDEKGINDKSIDSIWNDINIALKGTHVKFDQLTIKSEYDRLNYNILVSDDKLKLIAFEMRRQCCCLSSPGFPGPGYQRADIHKAASSLIQIGKQSNNIPLLMWLVDAYNRFRIQRRKRFGQKYTDPWIYFNKFYDIDINRFITTKCRGFTKWLIEYSEKQQNTFKEICNAGIKKFGDYCWLPLMKLRTGSYIIDDNIIQIGFYILQCYDFIEQLTLQNNSPLPVQIDIVFVVKNVGYIPWDYDDHDSDDEYKEELCTVQIDSIDERLKTQKNKCNPQHIEWKIANNKLLQCTNKLIENKHNQRIVLIIDRRNINEKEKLLYMNILVNGYINRIRNQNKYFIHIPVPIYSLILSFYGYENIDKLYAYQPNQDKECHSFESDMNKFLHEGLVQNSRNCILPKLDDENHDIGVSNHNNPQCFTLSFHCIQQNEISVYLYYDGWGTRFFIEDIKYFLPMLFEIKQRELLKHKFEHDCNRDFSNKYYKTQTKCKDVKFERFFKALVDGKTPH